MPAFPTPRRIAQAMQFRRTRTVEDSRMSLTEHLRELRDRLVKALVALAVAAAVCFYFEPHIFNFLKEPYCSLPADVRSGVDGQCQLAFFGILDAFMIRLKISMIAGAVFSSPVWLYQLWSFITPGLHRHERRWSLTFVGCSLVLFTLGAFFAYLTLSTGLELLLGFSGDGLVSVLDVNKYLSYVIAMLLVFGLSFEIPLLVAMLNLAGVVSTAKLRSWRRAEIFLVFVFAAIVTPSQDPFTMIALGLPMVVLYEVALVIGWANDRRKARHGDTSPYAGLDDDEASPLDLDLPHPVAGEPARPTASADPVGTAVGATGAPGSSPNATHIDIT
ncbi:twin-arginine translocase subunit TatC [Protofrankia coriariae]|uniref:Sec-independent protein translocase protein TatC n=1 Tax=Protofrankia coriariae TaxID=1562887 RepID=A0ABR5F145_9ACTN|nr:twin-arginine translocase subunit TatC [Protofrankia coriariae]KLL10425.1 preprotein translocase subunit TatC [Protofrankia coriariae]